MYTLPLVPFDTVGFDHTRQYDDVLAESSIGVIG